MEKIQREITENHRAKIFTICKLLNMSPKTVMEAEAEEGLVIDILLKMAQIVVADQAQRDDRSDIECVMDYVRPTKNKVRLSNIK